LDPEVARANNLAACELLMRLREDLEDVTTTPA